MSFDYLLDRSRKFLQVTRPLSYMFCRVCMNLHDNSRVNMKNIVAVMTPRILLV